MQNSNQVKKIGDFQQRENPIIPSQLNKVLEEIENKKTQINTIEQRLSGKDISDLTKLNGNIENQNQKSEFQSLEHQNIVLKHQLNQQYQDYQRMFSQIHQQVSEESAKTLKKKELEEFLVKLEHYQAKYLEIQTILNKQSQDNINQKLQFEKILREKSEQIDQLSMQILNLKQQLQEVQESQKLRSEQEVSQHRELISQKSLIEFQKDQLSRYQAKFQDISKDSVIQRESLDQQKSFFEKHLNTQKDEILLLQKEIREQRELYRELQTQISQNLEQKEQEQKELAKEVEDCLVKSQRSLAQNGQNLYEQIQLKLKTQNPPNRQRFFSENHNKQQNFLPGQSDKQLKITQKSHHSSQIDNAFESVNIQKHTIAIQSKDQKKSKSQFQKPRDLVFPMENSKEISKEQTIGKIVESDRKKADQNVNNVIVSSNKKNGLETSQEKYSEHIQSQFFGKLDTILKEMDYLYNKNQESHLLNQQDQKSMVKIKDENSSLKIFEKETILSQMRKKQKTNDSNISLQRQSQLFQYKTPRSTQNIEKQSFNQNKNSLSSQIIYEKGNKKVGRSEQVLKSNSNRKIEKRSNFFKKQQSSQSKSQNVIFSLEDLKEEQFKNVKKPYQTSKLISNENQLNFRESTSERRNQLRVGKNSGLKKLSTTNPKISSIFIKSQSNNKPDAKNFIEINKQNLKLISPKISNKDISYQEFSRALSRHLAEFSKHKDQLDESDLQEIYLKSKESIQRCSQQQKPGKLKNLPGINSSKMKLNLESQNSINYQCLKLKLQQSKQSRDKNQRKLDKNLNSHLIENLGSQSHNLLDAQFEEGKNDKLLDQQEQIELSSTIAKDRIARNLPE